MTNKIKHAADPSWQAGLMNPTGDAFDRYLDLLIGTMDDEVSGEVLACRLHMSRTHFDRVICAAAGETPGALRRRILLERAAYRLVAEKQGVLRAAVEAGYASHEAFTRAFTKAYGQPPSRWRRRHPPSLWLGTSAQVHFHPPGGLRVPARSEEPTMNLVERLVEHHVWLVGELLTHAQRLSAEQLNTPIVVSVEGIDPGASPRAVLAKLIGQMAMWNAVMDGRAYDFEEEKTDGLPELRRKLGVEGPAFVERVRMVIRENRLDETFVDALCEPAHVFTYGGMFAHVLTFSAHRRMMVLCALDVAGITDLGAGDPMEWVADTGRSS